MCEGGIGYVHILQIVVKVKGRKIVLLMVRRPGPRTGVADLGVRVRVRGLVVGGAGSGGERPGRDV